MTKQELIDKLLAGPQYKDLTNDDWNKKSYYRGLHLKKDFQLDQLEDLYPEKIMRLQERLEILQIMPLPTSEQKELYQQKIDDFKAQIKAKKDLLKATIDKTFKQKLADEIGKIYGWIDELNEELNREEEINSLKDKVERLKDKFITVVKEKELRSQKLYPRSPIGTTYYLDFDGATGNLTGTWTFTNGSTTVSANSDGAATSELAAGNYVRVSNGTEWYKVASVTDDNNFEITSAFQQATVTDGAGTTKYNNYDGTATTTPFVHLNQFTTDTTRTAGDILKVRANQTHHYDGIGVPFDEDGNADNLLTIKGCSTTDDPWNDASDVKPIISFGSTGDSIYLDGDDYWKFERLEITEGNSSYGAIQHRNDWGIYFVDCSIHNNSNKGMVIFYTTKVEVDGCEFYSNGGSNIYNKAGLIVKNSSFDGSTDGIYSEKPFYMENCTFGTTTANTYDVELRNPETAAYARNCKFASGTEFRFIYNPKGVYSEDHDQVKGDHKRVTFNGTVTKDTSDTYSGGASSSAKLEPNSYCGKYYPLTISDDFAGDFKLWVPASQKTITLHIKTFGYTSLPSSDELYIEASYLDEATGGHRATIDSTNTVSANDTWTNFSVTFTPSQEGWVYVTVYLKKYEASSGAKVDIKPVIS